MARKNVPPRLTALFAAPTLSTVMLIALSLTKCKWDEIGPQLILQRKERRLNHRHASRLCGAGGLVSCTQCPPVARSGLTALVS